jgi:SpoVK/Ycf46/Vps4 family AAA+-type ATPase
MLRFEITAGQNSVPECAFDKSKKTSSTPTAVKVVRLCRIALVPVFNPRCIRSILVTGPSGSGKSYLVDHVIKVVSQSVLNCQIIRLNIKLCESDNTMFSEPARDCFENNEKFDNYLTGLLELIQKTAFTWNPVHPLLLCLEDIDSIFFHTKALIGKEILEDDGLVTGDGQSNIKSAAIKLRQLLSILCRPDFSFPVVIVATTLLSVSEVPSIYSGAPGFEKVLDIPKPTKQERQKIFKVILPSFGIPLGSLPESLVQNAVSAGDDPKHLLKDWAYRLASMTPGTLPGDLVSIIEKSVATSVGELDRTDGESISPPILPWKCVINILSRFTPSELCSLDLSQSFQDSVRPTWDSFGGYSEEKSYLKRMLSYAGDASKIDTETVRLRKFQACPTGLLITGFSGCGKTFLARVIACEAKMNFLYIKSNELLSPYLGQTEAKVRSIFQKARSTSPCVLFFDDFDTIACRRELDDGGGQSNLNARILSTFLNEIDGISTLPSSTTLEVDPGNLSSDSESTYESHDDINSRHDVQQRILVIASCFDETALDDALLRPGRLYYKVRLNKPTEQDLFDILSIRMAKLPIDKSVSLEALSKLLFYHGATGADVHDLCSRATLNAIRMIIESGQSLEIEEEVRPRLISLKHFEDAIKEKY